MLGAVFSVKNTADVTTKHGFVGAGFKPAQGVSGTSRDNFPPQGGFVPLTFMAHIATPRTMKFRLVFVKKRRSRLTFTNH